MASRQPMSGFSMAQVQELIERYGWNTMACQILAPGMRHWLSTDERAVIGYVQAGRTRVAAGAPICSPERLASIVAAFAATAAAQHQHVSYFGAQTRLLTALAGQYPQSYLPIGAQPVWNPQRWRRIVEGKASLRAQLTRATHKGITIVPLRPEQDSTEALRRCQQEWLARRGLPPLQFLVTPDILDDLSGRQMFLAYRHNTVVAYLAAVPIPQRQGWLIEQIVRGAAAPNGTAELLIDAAMRHVADRNAQLVTLGLSPFSTRAPALQDAQPLLIQLVVHGIRRYGQRWYNLGGLDSFKAKLQPDAWEPVYVISHEPRMSWRTLYAIVTALCGTAPPTFVLQALRRRWPSSRSQ